MNKNLGDKTGKILVVDNEPPTRSLISDILKSMGFSKITQLASVRDILQVLELEQVDWVITSLFSEGLENAMHLLKIAIESDWLDQTRISFIITREEEYVIPTAFEHGLLSYHLKPVLKSVLETEFRTIIKNLEAAKWRDPLVAASFLRKFLVKNERLDELLHFEKNLLSIFPDETDQLFNLIYPLMKLGNKNDALALVRQIRLIVPGCEERIRSLQKEYLPEENLLDENENPVGNLFGIESITVVDPDESSRKSLEGIFNGIGVANIHFFSDGQSALHHLSKSDDTCLVIQEWRIPKLTGPIFLQNIKQTKAASAPIVVLSSLVKKEDAPLLREMGVSAVIEKPFNKDYFLQSLIAVLQQHRAPSEKFSLERKIRDSLATGRTVEAFELRERYFTNPQISPGQKKLMDAEFAYANKNYEKAKGYCIEAIKLSGDSIFILNLLGKILIGLRDFENALRCFEKARALSPLNIERLCAIAEVHSQIGDTCRASSAINEAKDLDEDNPVIKETEAKVALNSNQIEIAREIMEQLETADNIVAYMNNSAIAMALCGMLDESISQYRRTLEALPKNREKIKAIILYNLALAHARKSEIKQSKNMLDECIKIEISRVHGRAESLLSRLNAALERGSPAELRFEKKSRPESAVIDENTFDPFDLHLESFDSVRMNRGDLACYMIYFPQKNESRALKLMEEPPPFNPWKSLEYGSKKIS
ncbi:MAG: response regulator [Oligoflexales bacterium]|nr:response regulator [Oligoflexales bacterium]